VSAVYGYDIRATRKGARKIKPETWDNERTLLRAVASLARMRANWPGLTFVLIERSTSGKEREVMP
jgi:hypothetical protein